MGLRHASRLQPSQQAAASSRREKLSRSRTAVAVVAGLTLGVAVPAAAHYADFTGSIYQRRDVPAYSERCLLDPNSGCDFHSWTFVSAQDVGGQTVELCALIYLDPNTRDSTDQACATGFVRNCDNYRQHSSNPLDCHDQDTYTGRRVGTYNLSNRATVIEIHGGY